MQWIYPIITTVFCALIAVFAGLWVDARADELDAKRFEIMRPKIELIDKHTTEIAVLDSRLSDIITNTADAKAATVANHVLLMQILGKFP